MTQKYMQNGDETFCCVDTSAEPNMEAGQGMMSVTDEQPSAKKARGPGVLWELQKNHWGYYI